MSTNNIRYTTSVHDFTERHIFHPYLSGLRMNEENSHSFVSKLLKKPELGTPENYQKCFDKINQTIDESLQKFSFSDRDLRTIDSIRTVFHDLSTDAYYKQVNGDFDGPDSYHPEDDLRIYLRQGLSISRDIEQEASQTLNLDLSDLSSPNMDYQK